MHTLALLALLSRTSAADTETVRITAEWANLIVASMQPMVEHVAGDRLDGPPPVHLDSHRALQKRLRKARIPYPPHLLEGLSPPVVALDGQLFLDPDGLQAVIGKLGPTGHEPDDVAGCVLAHGMAHVLQQQRQPGVPPVLAEAYAELVSHEACLLANPGSSLTEELDVALGLDLMWADTQGLKRYPGGERERLRGLTGPEAARRAIAEITTDSVDPPELIQSWLGAFAPIHDAFDGERADEDLRSTTPTALISKLTADIRKLEYAYERGQIAAESAAMHLSSMAPAPPLEPLPPAPRRAELHIQGKPRALQVAVMRFDSPAHAERFIEARRYWAGREKRRVIGGWALYGANSRVKVDSRWRGLKKSEVHGALRIKIQGVKLVRSEHWIHSSDIVVVAYSTGGLVADGDITPLLLDLLRQVPALPEPWVDLSLPPPE